MPVIVFVCPKDSHSPPEIGFPSPSERPAPPACNKGVAAGRYHEPERPVPHQRAHEARHKPGRASLQFGDDAVDSPGHSRFIVRVKEGGHHALHHRSARGVREAIFQAAARLHAHLAVAYGQEEEHAVVESGLTDSPRVEK